MLLLEITERMATNQVEEATRTLDALREMGVGSASTTSARAIPRWPG